MKNALIFSAVCILLGLAIIIGGMIMISFDFTKLNTIQYETKTYTVDDDFQNITINSREHTIMLAKSKDDTCKVVYTTNKGMDCSIAVTNEMLNITYTDTRAWYERIGIYWGDMGITVYLPQTQYDALYLQSVSGSIQVTDSFRFASAKLISTSGDIHFCSDVNDRLEIQATSGDITVYDSIGKIAKICTTSGNAILKNTSAKKAEITTVSGDIVDENAHFSILLAETTSGEMQLKDSSIDTLYLSTTSGDILLSQTVTTGSTDLDTASGDVRLDRANLVAVKIKTISGDVKGTLTKAMDFYSETISGSIRFPTSDSAGGYFKVITTSGDVNISIAE